MFRVKFQLGLDTNSMPYKKLGDEGMIIVSGPKLRYWPKFSSVVLGQHPPLVQSWPDLVF